MAKIVSLKDGYKVGDKVHKDAELRLPRGGDIIDAGLASERAVLTADGYVLLQSPTLIAQHVLARQIARIGDYTGPFTIDDLRLLSQDDLQLLQQGAEALDQALHQSLENRGRAAAPGEGAGAG